MRRALVTCLLPLAAMLAAGALSPLPAQVDHPERLHTSRAAGRQLLRLPKEDDAFGFVIYGDRTGGPASGIEILKQAVVDTNLLDPDLVMTVGDLVQGYNDTPAWQRQAAEFKTVMGGLRMPWFPVAGNHDVYYRGPNPPPGEHEGSYEATFGPLWYSFRHKRCRFVVLYSDEGDPQTGEKDFNKPAAQRISPAQFEWLQQTLTAARDDRHVFVFLHHPRWLTGKYGDDWQKVHAALVAAGNVRAVFAGHIHRMRYDGARDGIEYFTLATTGGVLEMEAAQAGYLHELHAVTVRPGGIQVATLPVGAVMDPRRITGEVSEDAERLNRRLLPAMPRGLTIGADGTADGVLTVDFTNPARRPVELTVTPLHDGSWGFTPDHTHLVIPPGATMPVAFAVSRTAAAGTAFDLPRLELRTDYLGEGLRFSLPRREAALALPPPAELGTAEAPAPGTLQLDGRSACLRIAAERWDLADGPFTVECWVHADQLQGRRGVVARTESSEWSILLLDGVPEFLVHLDGSYARARAAGVTLQVGRWHHLAGVFDGQEMRLYVDGERVAATAAVGSRTPNRLPLFIGADPGQNGAPGSFFHGRIDDVRVSAGARHQGERFAPPAQLVPDQDTVLLLPLDRDFGPWTPDRSPRATHPERVGAARCVAGGR